MSSSFSYSSTFTITHAREIASRVSTDLHLCGMFYGTPTSDAIGNYLEELAHLIKDGYLLEYEFGFKKDGKRIPGACCRYRVTDEGELKCDSPGGISAGANVTGASYYNFVTYSLKWSSLSDAQREAYKRTLPIQRSSGDLPSDGNGYWVSDKTYSSGGRGVSRSVFVSR